MSSLVGKHVRDGNVMALEASQTQWKDERTAIVERMLAGGGKPGVMEPAQLVGKSGLELLRGMLRGELPYPYIADTLDFALMAIEAGTVTFQGTPQLKHYNPMGTHCRSGRQALRPCDNDVSRFRMITTRARWANRRDHRPPAATSRHQHSVGCTPAPPRVVPADATAARPTPARIRRCPPHRLVW